MPRKILHFSTLFGFFWFFQGFFLWLLLKVSMVTTKPQKWLKIGQNSIISRFLLEGQSKPWAKAKGLCRSQKLARVAGHTFQSIPKMGNSSSGFSRRTVLKDLILRIVLTDGAIFSSIAKQTKKYGSVQAQQRTLLWQRQEIHLVGRAKLEEFNFRIIIFSN